MRNFQDLDEESGVSEKNPWKEIEGTVRKVDEDKVKDCTEDVDALLVFVRELALPIGPL